MERPSSDDCGTRSSSEHIDFMAILPFAIMVGPQAGLQAVCIRVLARLHRVLARRLAYSPRVLVHKGPCLQAERISFASRYSYGPTLRELLHNPQMYARISLSMQNKFESKHAQALWELCVDYLGAGRDYGETAYIAITTYRKLLGVAEGQYARFKDLSLYEPIPLKILSML